MLLLTVERRHNKCCINHCVSPGQAECSMNDSWLSPYNREVQSGLFSWNNSFDDPWGWSGRLRQERPGQVILVWNIDWHWQTVSIQRGVDYHKEEAWAWAWQWVQETEDMKKKKALTRIADTKAWPRPPCWLQRRATEPDKRRRANTAVSQSISFSLFFLLNTPTCCWAISTE